ncbi:hypothetical protein [Pseudoxanthomonas sacheonensis]|uniref:Uncharacterized protein n=1 Tax=Pseudoxanthomonas sacheonensis TaxID=443615 RepID=A0ABU1RRV7_9GAMM|nr:hypothetical protein [Pseudoxanthomonas sacheonensis]MDR6841508.1 hypothetical protein [Pseudoxanthomonas sacheonensis]
MKALFLLLVICGQFAVTRANAGPIAPEAERLTLGGITIGQSEASVIATLGKPRHRKQEEHFFLPITLVYRGLVVSFDEQGVGGVLSTSKKFCTPAKICPGMTYAQVVKAYGPSDAYERDGATFRDYLWDDGCWLRLKFQAGTVSTVETTCSP